MENPNPTGELPWTAAVQTTIRILDVDPDLAAGLEPAHAELAYARSRAGVLDFRGPGWDPSLFQTTATPEWFGLFVVDGLLIRMVSVGSRTACELFGPGDLIRPWDTDGEYDPVPITVAWKVPMSVRLAVLDDQFARRIASWPLITSRLIGRVAGRARALALSHAISHLPRAESRLLILFWLLAERWGTVGRDGITITLPLTHDLLATLVGVRRPAVSLALQRLAQAELLTRPARSRWQLSHRALDHLHQPESLKLIEDGASPHPQ